jgi:hypothetical protein
MHTWDIERSNILIHEDIVHWNKEHPTKIMDYKKVERLDNFYKFKSYLVEEYDTVVNNCRASLSSYINENPGEHPWWLPWFYSWDKSVQLKKSYEDKHGILYDYVIKLRPDVIFRPGIHLEDILKRGLNNLFGVNQLYDPDNMDDIIFISSSEIADDVSDWWKHRIINRYYLDKTTPSLCYLHRYISTKVPVVSLGLNYLGNEHSISLLRDECTIFDTLLEYEKCAEGNKLLYHIEFTEQDVRHITSIDMIRLFNSTNDIRKFVPPIIGKLCE